MKRAYIFLSQEKKRNGFAMHTSLTGYYLNGLD
jgi:hypothetical protein